MWGVPDPKDTVLNKLIDTTFPFTEELGYFLYQLSKHYKDKLASKSCSDSKIAYTRIKI